MLLTWLFSDHRLGQQTCIHPTQLEILKMSVATEATSIVNREKEISVFVG